MYYTVYQIRKDINPCGSLATDQTATLTGFSLTQT